MVVSEEDNPNNTTTVETEKGIIDSITDSPESNSDLVNVEDIQISTDNENKEEEISNIFDNNNDIVYQMVEENIENITENNDTSDKEYIEVKTKNIDSQSDNEEIDKTINFEINSEISNFEVLEEENNSLDNTSHIPYNKENETISENIIVSNLTLITENVSEIKNKTVDNIDTIENVENNIISNNIVDNEEVAEEIISTDIVEELPELMEEYIPKDVEIPFENGIETGLEILYTSMKLKDFPIKESNLPYHEESIENISLNSANIHIGDTILSNVNIRILGYSKFKLIEFKTREFKVALSIALFDGNTIRKQEDYFSYEIFSKLKNSRVYAVAEILKSIFSGEKITFQIKDLFGEIQFENPIQSHKFNMIIESINKYEEVMKLMNITKVKNFSESSLQFYTLHLLHSYLNNTSILNSWINFRINNKFNINIGDKISFTKIHDLNIRGFNYNLKETAIVKSSLSEKEVNLEKNIVSGYRKTVDIKLELLEKQF